MITAEQKPILEIKKMIGSYRRILVLGCGSCVAECAAGGEKESCRQRWASARERILRFPCRETNPYD